MLLSTVLMLLVGCDPQQVQPASPAAIPDREPRESNEVPATEHTPLVIAHRGASGLRPEHTLAAYQAALVQGADFIELDLVATRDGVLVARHENLLAEVQLDEQGQIALDPGGQPLVVWETTDVAQRDEFVSRLVVKRIDGRQKGGWFSEDFTLAELKTLRARERMPAVRPLNRLFNDLYSIPTLEEVIKLVQFQSINPDVGLYLELKHPTYFRHEGRYLEGQPIGTDLSALLLETLSATGFVDPQRLYIQCFEVASLIALRAELDARQLPIPLVQLYGDITNTAYRAQPYDMVYYASQGEDPAVRYGGLNEIVAGGISNQTSYAELSTVDALDYLARHYAAGVGPPKFNLLPVRRVAISDPDGDGPSQHRFQLSGEPAGFARAVRAAGLELHPYTLRAEEAFLVRDNNRVLPVAEEAIRLVEAGATGFFIDQPAEGRIALAQRRNR